MKKTNVVGPKHIVVASPQHTYTVNVKSVNQYVIEMQTFSFNSGGFTKKKPLTNRILNMRIVFGRKSFPFLPRDALLGLYCGHLQLLLDCRSF